MPPVILPTIFPVALRVFSSALALPFGVIEHCRLVARKTYMSMIEDNGHEQLSRPIQEELRVTVELLRHRLHAATFVGLNASRAIRIIERSGPLQQRHWLELKEH